CWLFVLVCGVFEGFYQYGGREPGLYVNAQVFTSGEKSLTPAPNWGPGSPGPKEETPCVHTS
ncbi:MAG: hypothetical protein VX823_08715, partial [Actinomycetota bacterium]|nr:hypothetical protein [Actinomycetota bacterium]